jgi:hypothetical protein
MCKLPVYLISLIDSPRVGPRSTPPARLITNGARRKDDSSLVLTWPSRSGPEIAQLRSSEVRMLS